jgi:RNA polymerase sigma-70 factor, ECF subfamily
MWLVADGISKTDQTLGAVAASSSVDRSSSPDNGRVMPAHQEVLWLLQAQSGDRAAVDKLLHAIQVQLYGYLVSLVHDEHLADDLLQDVFVIVTEKLRWLREPSAFRAWVYRIASRAAFRALKTKRRLASYHETQADLDAAEAESGEDNPLASSIDRLPDLLQQLSPASRAVLSLHYLRSMTLQEVADVLEIPLGTAKARLAYGLRVLRTKLNQADW